MGVSIGGGLEAAAWGAPATYYAKASDVLYAVAQKKRMFTSFGVGLKTIVIPKNEPPADDTHYRKLAAKAPAKPKEAAVGQGG